MHKPLSPPHHSQVSFSNTTGKLALTMLYHLILASALSCNVLAGPLIKRDSPFATCTVSQSSSSSN